MPDYVKNHQVIDPVLQRTIIDRILREHDRNPVVQPAEYLGPITLPDGKTVSLYLRHAADAVLLDDYGQTVVITRLHPPGVGKLATPGGFIDGGETVVQAARREAMEETGISASVLDSATFLGVLPRRYDRPNDIRIAYNNLPGTNIQDGDVMMIPTQGVCLKVAGDLRQVSLRAGDDAGAVRVAKIADLTVPEFAVPDQLTLILEGAKLL